MLYSYFQAFKEACPDGLFFNKEVVHMSTNFRLELLEPSAREVEGQQFF